MEEDAVPPQEDRIRVAARRNVMTDWHVSLQFNDVDFPDPPDDAIDALFEALDAQAPTSLIQPGGRFSISMTIDDATPDQALKAARSLTRMGMRKARIPSGKSLVGIEMHTDEELDRLISEPMYPAVVGVAEVAKMLRVSKQRVSELARSRRFPSPTFDLAAGPIWRKDTIEAFAEKWERKPGRPRKVAAS
jgi:hypothetical protein